jgi:hypothetical protein
MLTISGCCCPVEFKPVCEFQKTHPQQAQKYSHLAPVTLIRYRDLLAGRGTYMQIFADKLKQNFGNVPGMQDFADEELTLESKNRIAKLHAYNEMEELAKNGGCICEFEWSDKTNYEFGLLVLKGGNVVKRDVFFGKDLTVNPNTFFDQLPDEIKKGFETKFPKDHNL